jgi:hypothetical protein
MEVTVLARQFGRLHTACTFFSLNSLGNGCTRSVRRLGQEEVLVQKSRRVYRPRGYVLLFNLSKSYLYGVEQRRQLCLDR